jgi:5-methylcytosine-specific restriction endonuclease McrA
MTYEEKLKDQRWIDLRDKALDCFRNHGANCVACGNPDDIQVHHIKYVWGREPWDYSVDELTPLCKHCHSIYHKNMKLLKSAMMNHQLFFAYEFAQIMEAMTKMCDATNFSYPDIIKFIESKKELTF